MTLKGGALMLQRPLLWFAICWVAGSSCAAMSAGMQQVMILGGLAMLLVIPVLFGQSSVILSGILLLSLVLSAASWEWNDSRNISRLDPFLTYSASEEDGAHIPASASISGKMLTPVEIDGDRARFTLRLERLDTHTSLQEKVSVQVKLVSEEEQDIAASWRRGDSLSFTGSLEKPGAARNFGGFDYRQYLYYQEIHWIVKAEGAAAFDVQLLSGWSLDWVLRGNNEIRAYLGQHIDSLFGSFHGGYMKGLIIGERGDLDPDTFAEFSRLGLTHILAISGMHVAVFAGCLLFLFSRLSMTREASLNAVILALPLYVLLTGASPSVVRAGMMGMIGFYAARKKILKDGLHILSAAALIMLWYNPYFLMNISFQLSFLVTAGLMLFVPRLMPLLSWLPKWLAGVAAVTTAAQLISFPLTIYYFNQFSLLSLPANLLLVPVISLVVLPAGMICVLLGLLWSRGGEWLASWIKLLNDITFKIVEALNESLLFQTIWPSPTLGWIMAYYVLLFLLLQLANKLKGNPRSLLQQDETVPLTEISPRYEAVEAKASGSSSWAVHPAIQSVAMVLRRRGWYRLALTLEAAAVPALLSVSAAWLVLLYCGYQGPSQQGVGMVRFLDVGQGDCMLIRTPQGKYILVDGGGTISFGQKETWKIRKDPFEVGSKVVVPLLKKEGIQALDMVILTHNDQDHAGGLQAVLENIPVKSFWFNGTFSHSPNEAALLGTAVARGIPILKVRDTEVQLDRDTRIQFLNPAADGMEERLKQVKDQNHHSVVFVMDMNGARFLFTGDADEAAELAMLDREGWLQDGSNKPVKVDVLKAGHHGSKTSTSSAWLSAWMPRAAVVSAGVNNRYNHPHPDVVSRLAQFQAALYRTDQQGEIQMRIKRDGAIHVRTRLAPEDSSVW
ncbi:ComEC/Rec2 family competence protein [Paenibacillus sp. JSM ZJ436]|uniref:ComEC/Rec2 family competence protein n=1 Tax=Paenibacillus sp. JSM ZJ436 TaxID=3376190 RepID=UPI0037CAE00D